MRIPLGSMLTVIFLTLISGSGCVPGDRLDPHFDVTNRSDQPILVILDDATNTKKERLVSKGQRVRITDEAHRWAGVPFVLKVCDSKTRKVIWSRSLSDSEVDALHESAMEMHFEWPDDAKGIHDPASRTNEYGKPALAGRPGYDYESRVTGITYPSSATNSFGYNGFDARVSKTDSAGTSTYRRLGAGATSAVLGDGSASFTPGLSERRGSTTTFQHSGIKNADAQSGTGQTLGATRQYDAFGNIESSTGTFQGPFGYGGGFGYQSDADSNLKLLGHRYYDSSTGRFSELRAPRAIRRPLAVWRRLESGVNS
ncbi:MAG: hypothetical protein ABL949_01595 [Fimbriimonadaceae bacterium]